MGVASVNWVGLQIEGNLIAPDLTAELLAGAVKGQASENFGFGKSDKLVDEIAIAWGDARAYWAAFGRMLARLPEEETATSLTREAWAVPLFKSLGFDPVYVRNAEIVDGQTYAISHRAEAGEHQPPIHVIGCRIDLEKRPPSGNPRLSAHALVQEYLNRTDHLWAIVTNGLRWRLLRDSSLMTRLTYVEFDLEQILNGENFAEFSLFYRLFHRSRLPKGIEDADECLLEFYHQESLQQGGRVRDRLRDGVEKALKHLGDGFLQHQANETLRAKIDTGELTEANFHHQIILLIYRVLFLMVAESRDLLVADGELEKARIYRDYYSVERLRLLAEREHWRRQGFHDLWRGLLITFQLLDERKHGEVLGLSPLNGDLFGAEGMSVLNAYVIDNYDLLLAIRELSLYTKQGQLRRVNYAALDVEELGSVYESLLDLHPKIVIQQGIYSFLLIAGSERKSAGAYYTPRELANALVKLTLEPLIARKLEGLTNPVDKIKALLSLKILDPACGSGGLLLPAARRLALEVSRIQTGEIQPNPKDWRLAMRAVIQHCIYGVDINPNAVMICKFSLWAEGCCKGLPLSYLTYKIQCGNSLIGVLDLDCLTTGIPDEAFKPVVGDQKMLATALKKRNKKERSQINQLTLVEEILEEDLPELAEKRRIVNALAEDSPADIKEKERRDRELRSDPQWWQNVEACNLWTAAFFMYLTEQNLKLLPTTEVLAQYARDRRKNQSLLVSIQSIIEAANQLAARKRFFHWALEFAEVFDGTGFDCILANPPWERIKLQEKEFFAARSLEIANAQNKAARDKLIKDLATQNPSLANEFEEAKHDAEAQSKFIRQSGRYSLTAVGDVNLSTGQKF